MDNYKLLFFWFPTACFAGLAQLVEQFPRKEKIAGSSPVSGIDPKKDYRYISMDRLQRQAEVKSLLTLTVNLMI